MRKVKIILLNGVAGSGKDYYYSSYKKEFNDLEYITRFAFADAIKEMMLEFFEWDGKNKEGIWRTRMQAIGNFFRSIDKDVWVNYLYYQITHFIDINDDDNKNITIFITDNRFDNEVVRTKELFPCYNVIVKRLHRKFDSNLTKAQMSDISEQGISSYLVDEEIYLENK